MALHSEQASWAAPYRGVQALRTGQAMRAACRHAVASRLLFPQTLHNKNPLQSTKQNGNRTHFSLEPEV